MNTVLILNGPNLNLLGQREPELYGSKTLQQIMDDCERFASSCDFEVKHLQSNAEHVLIDAIHRACDEQVAGIVFNPAAFTHTSVALRDALLATQIPFVEVHLSQPASREVFRQLSYFDDIALGTIAGFGADSYLLGLQALINALDSKEQ